MSVIKMYKTGLAKIYRFFPSGQSKKEWKKRVSNTNS